MFETLYNAFNILFAGIWENLIDPLSVCLEEREDFLNLFNWIYKLIEANVPNPELLDGLSYAGFCYAIAEVLGVVLSIIIAKYIIKLVMLPISILDSINKSTRVK